MEITTKQLRIQPGKIISQINNGQNVIITYRGKPKAKIIPFDSEQTDDKEDSGDELFGIWKNRKDIKNVDQFVRSTRKGRNFDN